MPETPTPAEDQNAQETPGSPVMHLIQSNYYHRDVDNYPTSTQTILLDEGWFSDAASAHARCRQLNKRNWDLYYTDNTRRRLRHEAKIAEAEQANREAAAIRAAGMTKDNVKVPPMFVPETFEHFIQQTNHTSYEVIEVTRSDHDGIARSVNDADAVGVDVAGPGDQPGAQPK